MPVGVVKKVEENYVMVTLERQDMCGECHACEMLGEIKKCTLKCINQCESKEGNKVEVDITQTFFMKATFIMYGLPLIGLLVGVGIGHQYSEVLGILVGVICMMSILGVIKYREKHSKYVKMLPVAKRIIES